MAKRLVVGALLASVVLVAGGCGGGDESTTATTTTATDTGTAGAERLTEEQWADYEAARDDFVAARVTATAKLDACPDSSAEVFSTCAGPALDDLESAATALGDTLQSFTSTVTGDCQVQTAELITYVTPYVNAVQTLQNAIESGNVSQIPSSKDTLQTLSDGGRDEVQGFEEACAPV